MLTDEQIKKLQEAGYSNEKILSFDRARSTQEKINPTQPQSEEPGYFSKVGSNLVESVKNRTKQFFTAQKEGFTGNLPGGYAEGQLRSAGALAGLAGDVISAPISPAMEYVADKLSDYKPVQDFANNQTVSSITDLTNRGVGKGVNKYGQFKQEYPNLSQDIEATANIASLLPIGKGGQLAGKGLKTAGRGVSEGIERGVVGATERIAQGVGNLEKAEIGKTIKGVLPTRGGIINREIANAFELQPSDLRNIENISGNPVGTWVAKNNLIDNDLESTVKRIRDFSDNNYKTVRAEINKVDKTYKQDEIPRYKESVEELLKQNKDIPGLQKETSEIKTLGSKRNPTLADVQRLKELMDDNFNLYKVTGDPSVGRAKEGLRNIRKDLKEFIEKEVKNSTGVDIRPLNNNVQTAQAILKSQEGRAVRAFTRQELSLGDFGAFGSGTLASGGNPLVGVAAVFFKKLANSPDVRLRVAKYFSGLEDSAKTRILNQLEEGKLPSEFDKFIKKKIESSVAPAETKSSYPKMTFADLKEKYRRSPMSDQGGFAKLFEPLEEKPTFESIRKKYFDKVEEPSKDYNVGITNVAGRGATQSDKLLIEAQRLFKEGKFEEAQIRYNESVKFGIKKVEEAFKGTGIKVKTKPGFGVYDGSVEPNIDMVATVPKGKEDLFHYQLGKLADENFGQRSFITYRQSTSDILGVIDETKGISNEPIARFTLKTPATTAQIDELNALMKQNELIGGSFKNSGKDIDIINLSHYNKDYEKFAQQLNSLKETLENKGLLENASIGQAEVRHIGYNVGEAPTTYRQLQREFNAKNPELKPRGTAKDRKITSKVLERLPLKGTASKTELQQLIASQDIPALEKKLFSDLLSKEKDQIAIKDLAYKFRKDLLKSTPTEESHYASYGLENLDVMYNDPKTTLLKTGVSTGQKGHFGDDDYIGHFRTFKESGTKEKTVYVSEIQSDPFQRGIRNSIDDRIAGAKIRLERAKSELEFQKKSPANNEGIERYTDYVKREEKLLKDLELEKKSPNKGFEQLENLAKDNKYRKRLLEETLVTLRDEGNVKINLPTPSTAAKIEWGKGSRYTDDAMPYEVLNRGNNIREIELEPGDEVGYLGDSYKVIHTEGSEIKIAPAEKVNSFRLSDHIDSEVEYRWNEVLDELHDELEKGITPERAEELLKNSSFNWETDNTLRNIIYRGEKVTLKSEDDLLNLEQLLREKSEENVWYDLEDLYGRDKVFSDDSRSSDPWVYVVEDDGTVETFSQPSEYDFSPDMDFTEIDFDPSKLDDFGFSNTEKAVLDNYYDLQKNLKIIQKDTDIVVEDITDDSGNTWIQVIPNKNLKISAF